MSDIFTKEKRSEVMSKIRSNNTKPEMIVRKYLHKEGFRYSLHSTKLPGKPDIVLSSRKIVVFVNGCFWHGHKNCSSAKIPDTNREFWNKKITSNILRDTKNLEQIKKMGFMVYIIWTCTLKPKLREKTLINLVRKIRS